jgi:hypothetical protein
MAKGISIEMTEREAATLESALDDLLAALKRLDEENDPTAERIRMLKAETHLLMQQIRGSLDVEKTI